MLNTMHDLSGEAGCRLEGLIIDVNPVEVEDGLQAPFVSYTISETVFLV